VQQRRDCRTLRLPDNQIVTNMADIPSNAQIKLIRSLKDKKFRDQYGLFVVEGEKMVAEALQSDYSVEAVYRTDEVGENVMSRMTLLSSPSSSLALVRRKDDLFSTPALRRDGLYIALDSIRDPGNMGTILRLADWFGIDGVLASADSVDIFNPKVVQSTMGAIFRVDFHYCDIVSLCSLPGSSVFGTFLCGEDIYGADLSAEGTRIIVIGNESNGISPEVAACCNRRITIPSFAKGKGSESLNAAVATAITVSEFRRQGR